jgi:hypothetical protein
MGCRDPRAKAAPARQRALMTEVRLLLDHALGRLDHIAALWA